MTSARTETTETKTAMNKTAHPTKAEYKIILCDSHPTMVLGHYLILRWRLDYVYHVIPKLLHVRAAQSVVSSESLSNHANDIQNSEMRFDRIAVLVKLVYCLLCLKGKEKFTAKCYSGKEKTSYAASRQ